MPLAHFVGGQLPGNDGAFLCKGCVWCGSLPCLMKFDVQLWVQGRSAAWAILAKYVADTIS